jgi:ribosomal protein S17
MKIYLQNLVNDLKQFSASLDKQSMLVNKPWALIDSELGIQKLIFEKNNDLILSKNGEVTIGKWKYLAEAKCLLIDRGEDKILCNEMYFDDSVLMLKVDGIGNTFFVLANENNLPDLDAYSYLRKLSYNKYGILYMPLAKDRYLKIKPNHNNELGVGSEVSIDTGDIKEGTFLSQEEDKKISVENNKIVAITYLQKYDVGNNNYIIVEQNNRSNFEIGNRVSFNNLAIDNDNYLISEKGLRIVVVNSQIKAITYLKRYETKDSMKIVVEQSSSGDDFCIGDKVYYNGSPLADGRYKLYENSAIYVKDGVIIKKGLPELTVVLTMSLFLIIIPVITLILIEFINANN